MGGSIACLGVLDDCFVLGCCIVFFVLVDFFEPDPFFLLLLDGAAFGFGIIFVSNHTVVMLFCLLWHGLQSTSSYYDIIA